MKKAFLYPVRLLYPPRCTFCEEILPLTVDNLLCSACEIDYPLIEDPTCNQCGKQLAHDHEFCIDCKEVKHLYNQGIALYPYEGSIKESLYRFKYGGRRKYAQFFAQNMHDKLKETGFWHKVDLILAVPVSKERMNQRGYNQAGELAKHLSKISKVPYNRDILIRVKDTKPQSEFSPRQRSENIKDAFDCTEELDQKDQVILLIDDIYTTGSTINECAKILRRSGAREIYSCVVCIGSTDS